MKMKMSRTVAVCAVTVTALWSAGCAKQQVVKQDQMIPPAAAKPAPTPAPRAAVPQPKAEVKDAGINVANLDQANKQEKAGAAQVKAALEKVFFDFDSYNLSSQARDTLTKNADLIKKDAAKIRIEGHCDELGSDDYNLALGDKRAKAAQKYLVSMGIPAERLSTISYGKEKPADPGHDEAARAHNRRDEFVVSSSK